MDIYVRVSRVGGREGERFISPRVQHELARKQADLLGVRVGLVVEELDVSGGKAPEDRELEQLLRRCEEDSSAGIITYRLDRFSRSTLDTLAAVKRLRDCGARLVTVDDRVDTASD